MSLYAKMYEMNMYLLLSFIFTISVGIHPTARQDSSKQHYSAIHVTHNNVITS